MTRKKTIPTCLIAIAFIALSVCSCREKTDVEAEAQKMFTEIRHAVDDERFADAREMIDTLRTRYKFALNTRRQIIDYMPVLEYRQATHDLAIAKSADSIAADSLEKMKKGFVLEKDSRYQSVGFYMTPSQTSSSSHRTCLRGEVSEDGKMMIISVVNGKKLNHRRIRLASSSGITVENGNCMSFLSHSEAGYEEEATFMIKEGDSLLNIFSNEPLTVTCLGNGQTSYKLATADRNSIVSCCDLFNQFKRKDFTKHVVDSLSTKARFYSRKIEEQQ